MISGDHFCYLLRLMVELRFLYIEAGVEKLVLFDCELVVYLKTHWIL